MMKNSIIGDGAYVGLPWKDGGRDRTGLDCVGLAALWLREVAGVDVKPPASSTARAEDYVAAGPVDINALDRGDVVFFRERKTNEIRHVAVHLGKGQLLHILRGVDSRIEIGPTLLRRLGFEPAGVVAVDDVEKLRGAFADAKLGEASTIVLLVVSIALSLASALIKPKMGRFRQGAGRYSIDALVTRKSPELPLTEVLGKVALAGNAVFETQVDKAYDAITDPTLTKRNMIVVFCAGPVQDITAYGIHINGMVHENRSFFDGSSDGFAINPVQNEAEAVNGTIGADIHRPSITIYKGGHAKAVGRDKRGEYDRFFPMYGLNGCTYLVYRLINGNKFQSFNTIVDISGRLVRIFDSNGFAVTTVSGESVAGADGTEVVFKLANADIKEVTALTVNGNSYTHIAPGNQTGNVYRLNKVKGLIEFLNAPANAATISISYKYYVREWSTNPAEHLIWLLTEKAKGKGIDESKIDWPSFDALEAYCREVVTWATTEGTFAQARYRSNYAVDFRRPFSEHVKAILDACYAYMFISNGKIKVKPRKAESPVITFDDTNIAVDVQSDGTRRSTFKSEAIPRNERANRVRVVFHPADNYNAESSVQRDDIADQDARASVAGNDGIVEEVLKIEALDNKAQAEYIAEQILRENVTTQWIAEFSTTLKGLALEPGDVVQVNHGSQPTWVNKQFRIQQIGHDNADRLHMRCSEYSPRAYV